MKNLVCAVAVLGSVLSARAVEPIAFYDFSEGTDGANVETVPNRGTLGTDFNGTATTESGSSVTYSDDTPGGFLYGSQDVSGEPISRNWKSVTFAMNEAKNRGAFISMPGLGEAIASAAAGGGDFTVEFFAKYDNGLNKNWNEMVGFHFRWTGENSRYAKYVANNASVGVQMSAANPAWANNTNYGSWNHLAFVYASETGTWTMYRDGCLYDTRTAQITGAGSYDWLRIGGNNTAGACYTGRIAALRVTPAALTPAEFMRASGINPVRKEELGGALAFWPFTEGTPGEAVGSVASEVDAADAIGGAISGDASRPTYSDDVPGAYLMDSRSNQTVIARGIRSVKLARPAGATGNGTGGLLEIGDLRSRLAKAGAFTLEYFFKIDVAMVWCNCFAMYLDKGGISYPMKMADRGTIFTTQVGSEYSTTLRYGTKGTWHHVALEWDAGTKQLVTYINYEKVLTTEDVTLPESAARGIFGAAAAGGNECLDGKICAIRIMPRCLAPEEMMYARTSLDEDGTWDAHTVFHWGFESTSASVGDTIYAADADPVNSGTYYGIGLYSNYKLPTVSDASYDETRPVVRQGSKVLCENRFCARFHGYCDDTGSSWAGSRIEGARPVLGECIVPESFTFETFLRRDMSEGMRQDGSNGQLVAAFGNPTCDGNGYDWYVFFASSSAYGDSPLFMGARDVDNWYFSQNLGTNFNDQAWHHFALTYDAGTKEMVAYIDRKVAGRMTIVKGLLRTTDQNWVYALGRGYNTSGFNGWMDEVRVSDCVRDPSEFLRFGKKPGGSIILIR